MAVKGFSSLNFGNLKPPKLEIPNTDFSNLTKHIISPIELAEKQVEKQNEILEFLKNITIEQSKTAEKQSKNTLWMTILALVFAGISIIPIIEKWIAPDETKTLYQNIYELEKKVSSESTRNLEMYKSLLYLENQVKTLEKQNEQLKSKKPLKK